MITLCEIECSAHCNWRCRFCPVELEPKAPASMSMELFEEILDKVKGVPTIHIISINCYSEPTIDKLFMERVKAIHARGLALLLHTNGTGLTKTRLDEIKALGIRAHITFNMPSLDEKTFRDLTGSKQHAHCLEMIDYAIAQGLEVELSVNGTAQETMVALAAMRPKYGAQLKHPFYQYNMPSTGNRVGILKGKYGKDINLTDPVLYKCPIPFESLYINIKGELFLCCEDFHQETVYANIKDGTLAEILNSKGRKDMLSYASGAATVPMDFICRKCYIMEMFVNLRP